MSGMDHFSLDDADHYDRIQLLIVNGENMDKDDFLHTNYYVDESSHPEKAMKEASSSGRKEKGKKKQQERSSDEEDEDDVVVANSVIGCNDSISDQAEWKEPDYVVDDSIPETQIELGQIARSSQVRVSSASAEINVFRTPSSDGRLSKKRRMESGEGDDEPQFGKLQQLIFSDKVSDMQKLQKYMKNFLMSDGGGFGALLGYAGGASPSIEIGSQGTSTSRPFPSEPRIVEVEGSDGVDANLAPKGHTDEVGNSLGGGRIEIEAGKEVHDNVALDLTGASKTLCDLSEVESPHGLDPMPDFEPGGSQNLS